MDETTSRHLRNASEVLLWIPIQDEFARFDEQIISYASRLSAFLKTVFELRRDGTERRAVETAGPVERLQVVYNVQWTVLPDERRLLVAASFDRSWETYFRELADTTGALLDAIFCHCEGFEQNTCADDFDAFMAWVRKYQQPCDFFYAAAPDLTTDDVRYLKLLSSVAEPGVLPALTSPSRIVVGSPGGAAAHAPPDNIERALWLLYELRKSFSDRVELGRSAPKRTERAIFDGAVSALFFSEESGLQEANRGLALQLEAARLSLQAAASPSLALLAKVKDLAGLLAWSRQLNGAERDRLRKRRGSLDQTDVQALEAAQLDSIQAGILTDYRPVTTHGVMALVQCDTPASFRAFVDFMLERISTERDSLQSSGTSGKLWVNLSLTYRGLERSGLSESVLLQFPKEFREGMEARAGLLGDIGNLDYPLETGPIAKRSPVAGCVQLSAVDAVVLLQTRRDDIPRDALAWWTEANPFRSWLDELEALHGVRVLSEEPLQRQFRGPSVREHFGFVEGERGSQPVPRVAYPAGISGGPAFEAAAARDRVRLGEILLGYPNQRGEPARKASLANQSLLQDGSFLVVRKLRQDLTAFRELIATGSKRLSVSEEQFKTLVAGRAIDGTSPVASQGEPANDFDFEGDPNGLVCPHFAHTRRANPRTSGDAPLVPRILRRGFSYGPSCPERIEPGVAHPDESAERGLLFMAYNANIAEQFEVIQRWINGGNRTGLLSTQQDLLAGQGPISQAPYWHRASEPANDAQFGPPARPLVSLQWGAYLFVPSKVGLKLLRDVGRPDVLAAAERGEEIIERLLALERVASQQSTRAAWKKVLEEPISASRAADVWEAVRSNHGGALRTAYGVLIANLDLAVSVLRDDGSTYSVSKYGERLRKLIGPHYLGLDRVDAEYVRLAEDPNAFAHSQIKPDAAFHLARRFAIATLHEAPLHRSRRETHVRRLAEIVVLQLCHAWLELPLDPERLNALVFTSRYAFQVSPGEWLEEEVARQQTLIAAPRPPVGGADAAADRSALREYMRSHERAPDAEIDLALNGAIVGFAAPAIASIVSILDTWATDGELWRLAAITREANAIEAFPHALAALLQPVLDAFRRKPIPSLLYRTARQGVTLIAPRLAVNVQTGDTVIVGLGAVYQDARDKQVAHPEQWLFGGEYTEQKIQGSVARPETLREAGTSHGCPARDAALAVLIGVFDAVLSLPELRFERRFVLSYAPQDRDVSPDPQPIAAEVEPLAE